MNKFVKQFLPLFILLTVLLGACTNPFFTALLKDKGKPGGGFTPQTNTSTANDAETLGFVGTSAVSSDTGVATAAIEGGHIVITSVAEGSAVITVSSTGYTPAAIPVTVGADGAITIGTISKGGVVGGGGFIAVTGITGVPASGTMGEALALSGTATPDNATNRTIVWTVKDAGATGAAISGNTLTTTGAGTVVVTATIADGTAAGTAYTEDFSISISFPFATPAEYREILLTTPDAVNTVTITGDYTYYDSVFGGVREVTLSPFRIAKYETTYELWYEVKQWATGNGYTFANAGQEGHDGTDGDPPTGAKLEPVTDISWRDAIVWCNAYSEMSGKTPVYTYSGSVIRDSTNGTACDGADMDTDADGYRLPTEAEWEYAARGGGIPSTDKWAGTDTESELTNYAWYRVNAYSVGSSHADYGTHPVGGKMANRLGLHDMSGNAWEWCWDWWGTIGEEAVTNPKGAASGTIRVGRGGDWHYYAFACAVSGRDEQWHLQREFEDQGLPFFAGFRVACRP